MHRLARFCFLLLAAVPIALLEGNSQTGWVPVQSGTVRDLDDIALINDHLYIVGSAGTIIMSADFGASWTDIASGKFSVDFHGVVFPTDNTGWVVGDSGRMVRIVRQSIPGDTYSFPDTGNFPASPYSFRSIASYGDAALMVTGDHGTIVRYLPHFDTWRDYSINAGKNLFALRLVRSDAAYAVGDSGIILRGTVGGYFQPQSAPWFDSLVTFYGIAFNSDTGWVVGSNGRIAHTSNGGLFWRDQPSGVQSTLRHVWVNPWSGSANEVWICGDGGIILHTTDYGITWVRVPSGTTEDLRSMVFLDSGHGLAVGARGTILRTSTELDAGGLRCYPRTLSFGEVLTGVASRRVIVISNNGPDARAVAPDDPGNYRVSITPASAVIAAGTSAEFVVDYMPDYPGADSERIIFRSDAPGMSTVCRMSGTAVTAADSLKWVWQNPLPQGNVLKSVAFVTPRKAVAAGSFGSVVISSDTGMTWKAVRLGAGAGLDFCAMSFPTRDTGYLAGRNGAIYRTTDGGDTWNAIPSSPGGDVISLAFTGGFSGYTVTTVPDTGSGWKGMVFHTGDGGVSWRSVLVPGQGGLWSFPSIYPVAIAARGNRVVIVGTKDGSQGIGVVSSDGGMTWKLRYPIDEWNPSFRYPQLRCLALPDDSTIIAGGDGGFVLRSTDGWYSWKQVQSGAYGTLRQVTFFNSRNGIIISSTGEIISTSDGGVSFGLQSLEKGADLLSVAYGDLRHIIVTGANPGGLNWPMTDPYTGSPGIMRITSDGGSVWRHPAGSVTSVTFHDIQFRDPLRGWAVGESGIALQTTDAGEHWTRPLEGWLPEIAGLRFFGIAWPAPEKLTMIGDDGMILTSADSGRNWIQEESGTRSLLQAIDYSDTLNGCVVGVGGVILQTSDGGRRWISTADAVRVDLYAVALADGMHGIIAGAAGTILVTTDGGFSWKLPASGTSEDLNAIGRWGNTVIAAGDQGALLRSTNAGQSWSAITAGIAADLYHVSFANATAVMAVGDSGCVLRSNDAGLTWWRQVSGTGIPLYAGMFLDGANGFAAGAGGTIIATTSGGGSKPKIRRPTGTVIYHLAQNYPNPCNGGTTIVFDLGQPSHVTVRIVDLLGREVKVLSSGPFDAGEYRTSWNPEGSASGVYFCVMDVLSLVDQGKHGATVRKILVMR